MQRKITWAFLHHFLVLNIYGNFYSSIVSSVLLPESRKYKSSATLFIQNYARTPVFFTCSPKAFNSLKTIKNAYAKPKTKGTQKYNTFVQMLANICGINKLKWPRCLSLLKKILNLEEVFKRILTTKKSLIYRLLVDVVLYGGSLFLSSDSKRVQVC